jgi:hypothetical protein
VNIILGVIAILSTRMSGSQSVVIFAFTALILFFVAWRLGLITLKKTIIT